MYIGTSLGGCLRSILLGEVSEDQVLVIITRTKCPTVEALKSVLQEYHKNGNYNVPNFLSVRYDFTGIGLDDLLKLGENLYNQGKIHQPKLFGEYHYNYMYGISEELWLEIVPKENSNNKLVMEAYNKYRMLKQLVK